MNIDQVFKDKEIIHFYQPIYNIADEVLYGYEALIRLRSNTSYNVEHLFEVANEQGKLYELDTASVSNALSDFSSFDQQGLLFLNVFPSSLLNPSFLQFVEKSLKQFGLSGNNIVLELNETHANVELLKEAVPKIKNLGVRIALDDVGKGDESLVRLITLNPDIVKLDRFFSNNLSEDLEKQRLIELFVNFCDLEIPLLLEGIEETIDLSIAKSLGVSLGQGYLLGRPAPLSETLKKEAPVGV